jgi:diguanylate cyclase (GGDEF)-like protein
MDSKIKILYVEDEESIREGLVPVLKYFSDQLFIATDGVEGLEAFKEHQPDIIISDIKMPNMNGIEMVKEIKEINPKQHIIFTTAHSESGFFMEAIESHVDAYILKPIDLDILEEKILELKEQIELKRKYKKQQVIIQEISAFQDNLLIVLNKDLQTIFLNQKCLHFCDVKNHKEFNDVYGCVSKLFLEDKNSYIPQEHKKENWIEQILALSDEKRIVSMYDRYDKKIKYLLLSLKNIPSTQHYILNFSEATNLTIEKNRFEERAFHDELTQIYNRAYFNEILQKELAKETRTHEPLSFVIFDIDKFKNFNDTYGHQMGDTILKELAAIVKSHSRASDTFARWGGEEFVLILPNTSLENAFKVAQSLREHITKHIFTDNLHVSCSFGVSLYRDGEDVKSFLHRADDALYKAKANGRDRVEIEEEQL